MSNIQLYTSQVNVFGGTQKPYEKARYVILGVPFDGTSSYRTGSRFMPTAVRQASLNIETYSFRSEKYLENVPFCDVGDLDVSADTKQTIDICKLVAGDIFDDGKIIVAIGGEHTITLGICKALAEKTSKTAIISFDAHLDLRKEFLGPKVSHTTFMRRINEE